MTATVHTTQAESPSLEKEGALSVHTRLEAVMMLALGAPVFAFAPPPQGVEISQAWQCGTPLADGSTAEVSQTVTRAYAEFKNTYFQQMSDDMCCIKRPGE